MSERSRNTVIRRVLDRYEREDFISGRRTLNPRLSGVPVAQWRTLLPGHRRAVLDSRIPLGTSPEAVALMLDTPLSGAAPTPSGRPTTSTAHTTTPPTSALHGRGSALRPTGDAAHASHRVPESEPPAPAAPVSPTDPTAETLARSVVLCSGDCGRYLDARGHRPRGRYCQDCRPEPSRSPRRSRQRHDTHAAVHGYV